MCTVVLRVNVSRQPCSGRQYVLILVYPSYIPLSPVLSQLSIDQGWLISWLLVRLNSRPMSACLSNLSLCTLYSCCIPNRLDTGQSHSPSSLSSPLSLSFSLSTPLPLFLYLSRSCSVSLSDLLCTPGQPQRLWLKGTLSGLRDCKDTHTLTLCEVMLRSV